MNVVKLKPPKVTRLQCTACGAEGQGSCDCGVGYVRAGDLVPKAIAANPELSNRAIAEEFGVSEFSVRKARNSVAIKNAPETRVGKDGKKYPAKRKADQSKKTRGKVVAYSGDPIVEDCPSCGSATESWGWSLGYLAGNAIAIESFWGKHYPEWKSFEVSSELVTLAEQAAEAWMKVARDLKKRRNR
jgi:hypothetical protein